MKIKFHKLQLARRLVQTLVLAAVFAIPAVSRYSNYISAHELDKNLRRWKGSAQGTTLAWIDAFFRSLPGAERERAGHRVRHESVILEYAKSLGGGPWSVQIGDVSMTDPLAAAETVAAQKRVVKVLAVSVVVPLIAVLLLGRVFCSWVCPMGFLLDLTDKLRSLGHLLELHPLNLRFARPTKYALLGVGLFVAFLASAPVLGTIYPPAIITREIHGFVFWNFDRAEGEAPGFGLGGLTWASLFIVGIVAFELIVSRRWWCRYVCPGGALYSMLGAARPVRVRLAQSRCTKCTLCVPVCPMGLNPMHNKMGIECDNCGVCVSHCDDNALKIGLGPLKTEASSVLPGTRRLMENKAG